MLLRKGYNFVRGFESLSFRHFFSTLILFVLISDYSFVFLWKSLVDLLNLIRRGGKTLKALPVCGLCYLYEKFFVFSVQVENLE
jgi:hypothetical protein